MPGINGSELLQLLQYSMSNCTSFLEDEIGDLVKRINKVVGQLENDQNVGNISTSLSSAATSVQSPTYISVLVKELQSLRGSLVKAEGIHCSLLSCSQY